MIRQLRLFAAGTDLRRQLLQGGVANIALKMMSLGMNLLVTIVLARLLAPTGYGTYALALAIMSLLAVPIQLGLPTLVLREVTLCVGNRDWGLMRGLLAWAQKIVLSMSAAIGAMTVLFVWLSPPGKAGSGFSWTLLVAVPLLAIGSLTSIRQNVLMGMKRVIVAQTPELLFLPAVYLGCLALLWLWGARPIEPAGTMATYVGCYGAACLLGSVLLARSLPAGFRDQIAFPAPKRWAGSILPLSLTTGFSVISAQTVIPVLGFFSDEASVGLYRVAASGAALTTVVGATVGSLVAPYITTFYDRRDFDRLQLLAKYSAWACLVPALVALIAFSAAGEVLLSLTFGPQFVGAEGALVVLTVGQTINCGTGIVHSLLTMTGHERDTLRGAMVGTLVNVGLALALAPRYGLMGVAVATCLAVTVENVLLYVKVHSRLHIGSSVFSWS